MASSKIKLLISIFLFSCLISIPNYTDNTVFAVAPDNYRWIEYNDGIWGMKIAGIAINPTNNNIIYILTDNNGVYKTTNGGNSWTAANNGLPANKNVSSSNLIGNLLTIDPNNPLTLYININGKVYKTVDGGNSWFLSHNGITFSCGQDAIAGVIVDPTNSNHLYAASIHSGCSGGIFESTDGGASWVQIAGAIDTNGNYVGNMPHNDAWPITIDPSDTSKMYFSTVHEENFRSTNGGRTWTPFSLPTPVVNSGGTAVVVHPVSQKVLVGTGSGLAVSTDYGISWTAISTFNNTGVSAIKFAPSNTSIAYLLTSTGGIYKSADEGSTWTLQNTTSIKWHSLDIDPNNPDIIYLGSYGSGMYKSLDGGVTINTINNGLPTSIYIWKPVQHDTTILAAQWGNGIVRSNNSGQSWQQVFPAGYAYDIKFSPTNPNIVYAVSLTTHLTPQHHILKSTDKGLTWNSVYATNNSTDYPVRIAINPTDPNIVIATLVNKTLIKTINGGTSWSSPQSASCFSAMLSVNGLVYDPTNPDIVYGYGLNRVCKSTDGGTTWSNSYTGLSCSYCNWIDHLVINPSNTSILYAGTRAGKLFKSTNSGASWDPTGFDVGPYSTIWVVVDNNNPDTLYVSDSLTKGWYRSMNGGNSWETLPLTGLPSNQFPSTFIQDQNNPHRFIAGTYNNGVQIYENYIPKFHSSTFHVTNLSRPSGFQPDDILEFKFILKNSGPAQGTNPSVKFILPQSGISYVSGSTKIDGISVLPDPISNKTITVNTSNLSYNTSTIITFKATINSEVRGEVTINPTINSVEDTEGTLIDPLIIYVVGFSGSSPLIPSCNNEPPSNAPDLFQIDTTSNSATVYFTPAGNPYTGYYISYASNNPLAEQHGVWFNKKDWNGVLAFTINHLLPNTDYYFKVRGGNNCMPGEWSMVMKARTANQNNKLIRHYRYYTINPVKSNQNPNSKYSYKRDATGSNSVAQSVTQQTLDNIKQIQHGGGSLSKPLTPPPSLTDSTLNSKNQICILNSLCLNIPNFLKIF